MDIKVQSKPRADKAHFTRETNSNEYSRQWHVNARFGFQKSIGVSTYDAI